MLTPPASLSGRSFKRGAMTLALALLVAGWSAAPAYASPSVDWMLSYEGKSTNEFVWDKRTASLVRTRLPAKLSDPVLSGLGGPPDPVVVTDHRYVSVAACVPHDCGDKAFLWVDTKTGVGLGAAFGYGDKLTIGSNGLTASAIPQLARRALIDWITEQDMKPATVEYIGGDGASTPLAPAGFQPRERYRPAPGGPSFDCSKPSNAIETTICGDAELKALDRDLAELYERIRHGNGTVPARQELRDLQRAWLRKRNADCSQGASMRDCLRKAYATQQNVLMNWIPTHS
jgi:uncharacterized protein YecT (DUF1311 family)